MLETHGLIETRSSAVKVGEVYGRLTVEAVGQIPGTYRYMAVCQCSCGSKQKAIRFSSLKSGVVVACGCVQKERTTTHGLSKSAHYSRWRHIMDRCYNPKCKSYPDYGGRGISVCPEWQDLTVFVSALPDGYSEGMEIDRIDNDGDYEPGNVRWIDRSGNADNRRSGKIICHGGVSQSLRRWSEQVGIHEATLWDRLETWGWDINRALTTPPMTAKERMSKAHETRWAGHVKKAKPAPRELKTYLYDGRDMTIKQLSDLSGVSVKLLRKRICERDWPVEKAIKN